MTKIIFFTVDNTFTIKINIIVRKDQRRFGENTFQRINVMISLAVKKATYIDKVNVKIEILV